MWRCIRLPVSLVTVRSSLKNNFCQASREPNLELLEKNCFFKEVPPESGPLKSGFPGTFCPYTQAKWTRAKNLPGQKSHPGKNRTRAKRTRAKSARAYCNPAQNARKYIGASSATSSDIVQRSQTTNDGSIGLKSNTISKMKTTSKIKMTSKLRRPQKLRGWRTVSKTWI